MSSSPIRLVVYGNPTKAGLDAVLRDVADWAAAHDAQLQLADDIAPQLADAHAVTFPVNDATHQPLDNTDGRALLICVGGDGTLIHAVRRFWPLAADVLAINLGSLGFNASIEPEGVAATLEAWLEGRTRVSERMLIHVRHRRNGRVLHESVAVNDAVLVKAAEQRLIGIHVAQGDEPVSSFSADGLIVATPTGSTAYNLSAGGPIIFPTMRALVATAMCPHTLAARPVVLAPDPPVTMSLSPSRGKSAGSVGEAAGSDDASSAPPTLWIDGQDQWAVAPGDRIVVSAAERPLRLLLHGGMPYFSRLYHKLSWGGDLPPVEETAAS